MKEQKITTTFDVYPNLEALPAEAKFLMQKAIAAREDAYAPYSKFKVGAAVALENGVYVIGSNQENAAYPSGLCAERVAIFSAGANHPGVAITQIAITATAPDYELKEPVTSCGACRQAMLEYEYKQESEIEIFFMGASGSVVKTKSVANLLPLNFNSSFL
ncbi:cytidine deaminase [Gilvibacter sp.]|uniref:cytidine deaminase n=1 Tax=Gilvibacter sp. TaxID=2729997 RepID=UPI003F49C3D7